MRDLQVLKVPAGEWVLQNAAGSALGRQFIAIARRKGVRTINLVCRPGISDAPALSSGCCMPSRLQGTARTPFRSVLQQRCR